MLVAAPSTLKSTPEDCTPKTPHRRLHIVPTRGFYRTVVSSPGFGVGPRKIQSFFARTGKHIVERGERSIMGYRCCSDDKLFHPSLGSDFFGGVSGSAIRHEPLKHPPLQRRMVHPAVTESKPYIPPHMNFGNSIPCLRLSHSRTGLNLKLRTSLSKLATRMSAVIYIQHGRRGKGESRAKRKEQTEITMTPTTPSKHDSLDMSGSVYLVTSAGKVLSLPIPANSPRDPLNWSTAKRTGAYVAIAFFSVTVLVLDQCANLVSKSLGKEFTPEV
jgi:hypothetical protein